RIAQDALPLVKATEATVGDLPAYAQGRLRTKVFQTLGIQPPSTESARERELRAMWRWRWVLGLAAATAVVALLLVPMLTKPTGPEIQVAMLDTAGPSRGSDTNETVLLRQTWEKAAVESFSSGEGLNAWEASWAARGQTPGVKVVF